MQLAQLTVTIGRDLEDTGGGGKHEIDEYKASEHFKLSADRLDRLPYRHLSWEVCLLLHSTTMRQPMHCLSSHCTCWPLHISMCRSIAQRQCSNT